MSFMVQSAFGSARVSVPTEAEFDKLQRRVAELEMIITSFADLHSVVARLRNRLEDEK